MVKILKGDPINGYFDLKLKSGVSRFDGTNAHRFLPIAHQIIARQIRTIAPPDAVVVPIPNSHVTSKLSDNFRTLELVEGAAKYSNGSFSIAPALTFVLPQVKSHVGGSRDPDVIEAAYVLGDAPNKPLVLFDDVLTSGAHLIAAARKLRASGKEVVGALTFARATSEQYTPAFQPRTEHLDLDPPMLEMDDWF